ncbi:hypothetical protein, partial [Brachybacterium sp. ACRRE]|uniref:hypothetical protein n=1 Tax=Brachybacterium sp. ACRRE TaxID=2918184 RepID=UPI001EF222CD
MGAQPGTLRAGGVSYVEWPDSTAVVILDIGGALLVAGQSEAVELLRGLTPGQLTDVEGIESALRSLRPELVGKALLGYVDGSSFTPTDPSGRARQVDRRAMEEVISQCEVDDRDESGLAEMTSCFVVDEEGGGG